MAAGQVRNMSAVKHRNEPNSVTRLGEEQPALREDARHLHQRAEENYVLKEMGYRVARKHAACLRVVVQLCAFAVPPAGTAAALLMAAESQRPWLSLLRL
jgi:sulfite dehydrogenase (quinone) subunit SoeC